MISQQARDGFDHLLTRALRSSLSVSDEQPCDIHVIPDLDGIDASTTVVLTVSSYATTPIWISLSTSTTPAPIQGSWNCFDALL